MTYFLNAIEKKCFRRARVRNLNITKSFDSTATKGSDNSQHGSAAGIFCPLVFEWRTKLYCISRYVESVFFGETRLRLVYRPVYYYQSSTHLSGEEFLRITGRVISMMMYVLDCSNLTILRSKFRYVCTQRNI